MNLNLFKENPAELKLDYHSKFCCKNINNRNFQTKFSIFWYKKVFFCYRYALSCAGQILMWNVFCGFCLLVRWTKPLAFGANYWQSARDFEWISASVTNFFVEYSFELALYDAKKILIISCLEPILQPNEIWVVDLLEKRRGAAVAQL